MVNRRHIRIKVMQSIYAVLQSRSDDLKKQEKFLLFNIHKAKDLYVLQLLFLLAVRDLSMEHIEIKKKKGVKPTPPPPPGVGYLPVKQAVYLIFSLKQLVKFEMEKGEILTCK